MKILVTGFGVVSAIGNSVDENLQSLLNGKAGIHPIKNIKGLRKNFIGGEIAMSDRDLLHCLGLPSQTVTHRSALLGLMAAREAINGRRFSSETRTGLIFGTTIGGVDLGSDLIEELVRSQGKVDYRKIHDEGFCTDFIAKQLGINGYRSTLSTACSTAANSILVGARMIKAGRLDCAIVGGAEAITNYTLNGFDSLMLYDTHPCRPFDASRNGLNLGEGGGFIILENEKSALANKSEKIAELAGWANTCDAFHITASSPQGTGAAEAMEKTLRMANALPAEIDYINAHGTGTENNDLSESNAIQSVFGKNPPPYSSTKSFTGHTLAAAGGIEAVYSILAMRENKVFPTINTQSPMTEFSFQTERKISDRKISKALSNSFGFGGNCTSLLFAK